MKGVLTYKPHSPYDDIPERHYHFPQRYLDVAERLVGDRVLYYEPGEGARHYFAVAGVDGIVPDEVWRDVPHYYARILPGSYRRFAEPVPSRLPWGEYLDGAVEATEPRARRPMLRRAVRGMDEGSFARVLEMAEFD